MKYVVEQGITGLAETAQERVDECASRDAWNERHAAAFSSRESAETYRRQLIDNYLAGRGDKYDIEYATTAMCRVREVSDEYVAINYVA